jgi:curved DNA-binding protein CbpA
MQALVTGQPLDKSGLPTDLPLREAYAILNVNPGATRREVKRAYHLLALELHPDRRGGTNDGAAFKRIKDAYDVVCAHTAVEAELEAVDADLEEQERELQELERKRYQRENAARQQQDILDNILRFTELRRQDDARQRQVRQREAEARLRIEIDRRDPRTQKVLEHECQKEPPKAIMLEMPGKDPGNHGTLLLKQRTATDRYGNRVIAWVSEDSAVWIERHYLHRRDSHRGEPFWLLIMARFATQYALHSPVPYNTARASLAEMVKWDDWFELYTNYRGDLDRATRPTRMVSRVVDEDELGEIEAMAHREAAKLKEAAQKEELMAQLRAEEKKEEEERFAREQEMRRLQQRKDAAQQRANQVAAARAAAVAQEQVRQLELQDAAWRAFLEEVSVAPITRRLLASLT